MTATTPTNDVSKTQLYNALVALRHALRELTPTIEIAPDGHTAQIATLAGQTAQCARDCASIIDALDGYVLDDEVTR